MKDTPRDQGGWCYCSYLSLDWCFNRALNNHIVHATSGSPCATNSSVRFHLLWHTLLSHRVLMPCSSVSRMPIVLSSCGISTCIPSYSFSARCCYPHTLFIIQPHPFLYLFSRIMSLLISFLVSYDKNVASLIRVCCVVFLLLLLLPGCLLKPQKLGNGRYIGYTLYNCDLWSTHAPISITAENYVQ